MLNQCKITQNQAITGLLQTRYLLTELLQPSSVVLRWGTEQMLSVQKVQPSPVLPSCKTPPAFVFNGTLSIRFTL